MGRKCVAAFAEVEVVVTNVYSLAHAAFQAEGGRLISAFVRATKAAN